MALIYRLLPLSADKYADINQKKFYSANMQVICDANLIFLNEMIKWPGSHHDSLILESSTVRDSFENGEFGDCWVLVDSGWPLKLWLITPFDSPSAGVERRLNRLHRKRVA